MKRMLALVIIIICMLGCFPACTNLPAEITEPEQAAVLMPFGLKFGMTYDEAAKVYANIPELRPASSNESYICGLDYDNYDTIISLFGINDMVFPAAAYSFNQDEVLYEFYVFCDLHSANQANQVFNCTVNYYDTQLAQEAEISESRKGTQATWITDDLIAEVFIEIQEDGSYMLGVVLHSYQFDLDR